MIDNIIFAGDDILARERICQIGNRVVLFTPVEDNTISLLENSSNLGSELLELYENYDIVYLDTRRIRVTDLGMGFLNKFGVKFLNNLGEELEPAGINLYYIESVDDSNLKKDLKLRLIMSRPREHCANALCGRSFSKSPLEGELLSRAFHNLLTRLNKQNFNVYSDLRALDAGGFSSIVSSILRDDSLQYTRLKGVEFEYDHDIKVIDKLEV